jgi:uncharacterized protein (TIGR00290 family)
MIDRSGCSWSAGKDSCYALQLAREQGYQPAVLINMMNEQGKISRSHGLPYYILEQQAIAMGIPLMAIPSSWSDYESNFINTLTQAKADYSIASMIFGDIDFEPHLEWEEKVCAAAGLKCVLPLWKKERRALVLEMIERGIQSRIVSCNSQLGSTFIGALLTPALVDLLVEMGVDPCGENGEFHTVVIDCPMFNEKITLPELTPVLHDQYWFAKWPKANSHYQG